MARIQVGSAMPEYAWFEDFYDIGSLKIESHSASKATYQDSSGAEIVLLGHGLKYQGQRVTGGTVEGVAFLNEKGGTLISVTEGSYEAKALSKLLDHQTSLWDFMSTLTGGDDEIYGSKVGNDLNLGDNHGDDRIVAGNAGSYMSGAEGNDRMLGGAGWDTISFADTSWQTDDKHGIKLDAVKGTIVDSWGDKDTFNNKFEEFDGSFSADIMKGSNRDEAFIGYKGNDVVDGGGGWDTLRYQRDDHYDGKQGIVANLATGKVKDGFGTTDTVKNIEAIYGTSHNDTFVGDNHDNEFRGLDGVDSFSGGKGTDQVSFSWWEDLGDHGVTVDLTLSKSQILDDGFGNKETVKSIEALSGSVYGDHLKLGAAGGWVWGNDGSDVLTAGRAGDWLGGGAGNDTFVFLSASQIGKRAGGHCYIDDFASGRDKLDLSAISGLSFIGKDAFSETAGELRYERSGDLTYVLGDRDGDGAADFALELNGKLTLTVGDLIL